MRSLVGLLFALFPLTLAAPAFADAMTLTVAGGPGQQALALVREGGAVRARVCASTPCTAEGGALLSVPEDARGLLAKAVATSVTLAGGRVLALVGVPSDTPGVRWVMVLAAPLTGKGSEPLLLWSGWSGSKAGEHGEERSVEVRTEALAGGGARLLVGEHRADVSICGRPTLVGVREVDPATLSLSRGVSVQNLGAAERSAATKLTAVRVSGDAPRTHARLLRATAASSAVKHALAGITDGDLATAWSEGKPGDGHGEFVSMAAAEEVGIASLDLVVRPDDDVVGGASPKRLYLATSRELFEVTMPEDAWRRPAGTRYAVKLPEELHAACLTVVLDESFGKGNVRVTLAEVEAHTAFDGATPEALAGALAGGGKRAAAAAALLSRAGKAGFKAAMDAYEKLDEQGRRLAAGVVDTAPCADQVPFFAARFAAASADKGARAAPLEEAPELFHARDRLRRCGRAAAPALSRMVLEAPPRAKAAAAVELATLAPDAAVPVLLDAMGGADDALRRELRAALARAAQHRRAASALRDEVAASRLATRSETVAIDLLRAVGPSLGEVDGAGDAFASVAAKSKSPRGRYLLQAPAAELARTGHAGALGYLREALRKDQDFHVRQRAAEVAGPVRGLEADLLAALDDPEPRVREAAIDALAKARAAGGEPPPGLAAALGRRLATDDWTFARAASARALGAFAAAPSIDAALVKALADRSAEVRSRVLDGLGAHRAVAHAAAIRAVQGNDQEDPMVRAHAILALGAMCDTRSLSDWTKLARAAKVPFDDKDKRLGGASIAALGMVRPPDLAERLAPLLEKDTPLPVREMAKAALAEPGGCRR